MNILHIINNLNRDGAQKMIYYLASWDKNPSNRHIVCAWKRGGPLKDDLEEKSVSVFVPEDHSHSIKKIKRVNKYLDKIIQSQKIDVIHAHMADAAFWGSLCSTRHSIPLLITHHGNDLVPKTPLYFKILSQLLLSVTARFAKINIAVSESVKTKLKTTLYLNEKNIAVIQNAVPTPKDINEPHRGRESKGRGNFNSVADGPSIIAVGRLIDLKGHNQLIDAAPNVLQHFPNARFTFLGTGPLKSALEQRAKKLNIADHCIFPGTTNNVPSYLEKSDLYVTTSHHEGMPLATLEAMAWGVPVVASDVSGNRDIVVDEVTGLLYPLGDTEKLSKAILRSLNNPSLADSFVANGEKFIDDEFSFNKMVLQYEGFYKQLLIRNRK